MADEIPPPKITDVEIKKPTFRWIPIEELKVYPNNARKHTEEQIQLLMHSLSHYGWKKFPAIEEKTNYIVAGHGIIEAARRLGLKQIPCTVSDDSDENHRGYRLLDNKSAEMSEWEDKILNLELVELDAAGFNLGFSGFSDIELNERIEGYGGGVEPSKEDEVPAIPENPVTKPGDLYMMGRHRLLCGDCRSDSDMRKLFGEERAAVAVTSPPYASQRKYDESSGFKPIPADEYVDWFDEVQKGISDFLSKDGSFFLNIKEHCDDGERHLYVKDLVTAHVRQWGWKFVDEFAWVHGGTPKAVVRRFKNGWEPIFQFTRGYDFKFRPNDVRHESDSVPNWQGRHPETDDGLAMQRKSGPNVSKHQGIVDVVPDGGEGLAYPSNALSFGKNREALGHGAAFPVSLPEFFIKAYSDSGDIIFDPFMGSGSSLIAAEKTGRRGFGTEISPAYCDVIVKRWEDFTGKKAELAKTATNAPG